MSSVQTILFEDDFAGWNTPGGQVRWELRPLSWLPKGDGVATLSPEGLSVVPSGRNPETGRPAFAPAPEGHDGSGHLRWAAFALPPSGDSRKGFPLPEEGELRAEAVLSAELYGTDGHPYGAAVADPDATLKCGMAAMICVDMESGMVFDFALTNGRVWALYERLPRPGAEHGTFSYAVPVASRSAASWHDLAITVDARAGRARWLVDGDEVFAVSGVGLRLQADEYLARAEPGPEEEVTVRQLSLGLGLFADPVWGQGARLVARRARVDILG
ncbi:hypothetical protein SAMN05216489_04933 [Streptomyces sp. 3213]|uniref:DUF6081 family protein n=1 Tax=Streptomyces sp. 3213.3 TaxID=1855348 RepID=UPI00089D108B|nr:DUF6081 family protein [Streptomyces sp. 3213.3]SED92572.1 hypothetical protein SAMN05216489_04933 [Streptomyces sp. 3213] [Streptomyces sp. 3213.3]